MRIAQVDKKERKKALAHGLLALRDIQCPRFSTLTFIRILSKYKTVCGSFFCSILSNLGFPRHFIWFKGKFTPFKNSLGTSELADVTGNVYVSLCHEHRPFIGSGRSHRDVIHWFNCNLRPQVWRFGRRHLAFYTQ